MTKLHSGHLRVVQPELRELTFSIPYIGAGGRFTVSNTHIIVNGQTAENNTFDVLSYCAGPYFSYPISSRWQVGSKLLMEYVHYPQLKLTDISVNSIVSAISFLNNRSNERENEIKRGMENSLRFSWDKTYNETIQVYNNLYKS